MASRMMILIADGDYVSHSGHSERNQQRQRSFRPVGGGAERIQAENGHAFGGPYSFSLLFLSRKRSTQQQIEEIHGSILSRTSVPMIASNWHPIGADQR